MTRSEPRRSERKPERGEAANRWRAKRPECRGKDPSVESGAGVEFRGVHECINANGVEMIEGFVGGRPVKGSEISLYCCLKGVGCVSTPDSEREVRLSEPFNQAFRPEWRPVVMWRLK